MGWMRAKSEGLYPRRGREGGDCSDGLLEVKGSPS